MSEGLRPSEPSSTVFGSLVHLAGAGCTWSIDHGDDFWRAVTAFTGVRWMRPPDAVREGDTMPGVRWFPGATLNYADQALAPARRMGDVVAVVAESQTRGRIELTWSELADLVRRCAAGLRGLGVGPGVRVVAYAPNIPETLGGVPRHGVAGRRVVELRAGVRRARRDRPLRQIEPHVLVAIDGYRYGARDIDRRDAGGGGGGRARHRGPRGARAVP